MGFSWKLFMGAQPYSGASNVRDTCNRQTRTDRSRSSEEDNEGELTAEGIYCGPFIIVAQEMTHSNVDKSLTLLQQAGRAARLLLATMSSQALWEFGCFTTLFNCIGQRTPNSVILNNDLGKSECFISNTTDGFRWNLILEILANHLLCASIYLCYVLVISNSHFTWRLYRTF